MAAAGTLELQLIADVARLQSDMAKIKRAVGDMTGDVGGKLNSVNDNMQRVGESARVMGAKVTASAGAQRAGMQNLSYQINDVATQFAMGTNPMMIFAQQGSQVVQALSMMQGGASGLVGFLAGPWGATVMGATMILGPFIAKLFDSGDAAEKAADKYLTAADAVKQLIGAQNALRYAEKAKSLTDAQSRKLELENQLAGPRSGNAVIVPGGGFFGGTRYVVEVQKELQAVNLQIAQYSNEVKLADAGNAKLEASLHKTATAHARHTAAVHGNNSALREAEAAQRHAIAVEEAYRRAIYAGNRALDERMGRYAALNPLEGRLGFEQAKPQTVADQLAADAEKMKGPFDDAKDATAKWNAEMDASLDRLRQIGGVGTDIANMFGVLRGDFSGLSGAKGEALQSILGLTTGATIQDKNGKDVAETLGNRMESIFKKDGAFGKTMGSLLQGAGTGVAMSQAIFGSNSSQGSQIGGAVGGALGKVTGDALGKAVGGTLGKLAGPLGAIAGSLLGGVIGSLFSTKPHGSGSVTNTSVTSSGTSDQIKGSIDSFGLGTQTAINQIAEQLGGNVGKYSVGIGRYKDYYQVANTANDPLLGRAHYARDSSHDVYDGLDPQAALRAAIAEAIKQGAIEGVRAGTQVLLKAGTDIEAQLRKAMQFEGVFKDLAAATNPLKSNLDDLTKQFDKLRTVFKEAGASASDYASLEQLLAIKRQEAIDSASSQYNDLFFSDAEKAAKSQAKVSAEMQKLGLASITTKDQFKAVVSGLDLTTDAGMTLYGSLMKIAPEFANMADGATNAAKALSDQRKGMMAQLLEAQGNASGALAIRRQQELAAMDESLRGLQMQIYLAQDVSAARNTLTEAYKREQSALSATIEKFNNFATSLRSFRDSLLVEQGGSTGYAQALAQMKSTGAMAALGNENSLQALPNTVKAFLGASRDTAGSSVAYQRDLARALNTVNSAIGGAAGMASAAERQLAAMDEQVKGLIDLNDSVISVDQAINDLRALTSQQGTDYAAQIAEANAASAQAQADLLAEVKRLRNDQEAQALRMIDLTASLEKLARRQDIDGIYVRGATSTDPVKVHTV